MRKLLLIALLVALPALADQRANINNMLDGWHDAAAKADEERYFGAMTPEFVFLGTDPGERWDVTAFRAFSHPYFAKGKAWTFVPPRPPRDPRAERRRGLVRRETRQRVVR